MTDSNNRKTGFSEGSAASFTGAPATITATDAKNRFGELLDLARKEPVHVQKNGRTVAVLVSIEQFEAYEAASAKPTPNPLIMRLHEESKKRWGKVYEALAK
jgi:prevent-host-death family protein